MKLKKAMALLVAFCLIVPSPLALHAEEVNTSDVKTEQPADETAENSDSAQNLVGGATKGSDSGDNVSKQDGSNDGKTAGNNTVLNKEGTASQTQDAEKQDEGKSQDPQTVISETEQSGLTTASVQNGADAEGSADNNANVDEEDDYVAQVGNVKYTSIQNAITNTSGTIEINLLESTTESINIPSGRTVTLNLGEYTLTNADGNDTITNKGTLIVSGTKGCVDNTSHTKAALFNDIGGTATLNTGVAFTRSKENGMAADNSGGNSWYTILNHGKEIIIDGATVSNKGVYSSCISNGWYTPGQNTGKAFSTLTINSGSISGGKNTVKNDDYGILKITGGEFTNPAGQGYVIQNWNEATITGGTFITKCANVYLFFNGGDNSVDYEKGQLNISGGTFKADGVDLVSDFITTYATQKVSISGGYFGKAVYSSWCADGYVPSDDRSGAGAPEGAPYTVTKKVTISYVCNIDNDSSTMTYPSGGAGAGNKLTESDKSGINNYIKSAENDKASKDKKTTYVFQGWYTESGAKVENLSAPDVWPNENTTYVAHYKTVTRTDDETGSGDKSSAGDAEGNALPKADSEDVEELIAKTESAAAEVAKAEAAGIEVADNERVTVVVTVEANTKTEDQVGDDADKIKAEKKENEEISYFDISLLKTVVKEKTENNGSSWSKDSTTLSKLTSVSKEIPITLNVSSLGLGECFYRVAHVHDGKLTYLASELDAKNGLLTINMKEFSTVAILTSTTSTVTFESNGGSKIEDQTIAYNADAKVTKPTNAPTKSGYNFAGWFSDAACTSAYNFDTTVTSPAVTLYAKWTPVSTGSHKHHSSSSDTTTTAAAASAVTTVSGAKTGDSANLTLWAVLIVLAGACAAGIVYYEKKRKRC